MDGASGLRTSPAGHAPLRRLQTPLHPSTRCSAVIRVATTARRRKREAEEAAQSHHQFGQERRGRSSGEGSSESARSSSGSSSAGVRGGGFGGIPACAVDRELWELLEVADEDELQGLYSILFGSSPFSPLLKSLPMSEPQPLRGPTGTVRLRRRDVMRRLEARYRFLAADALSTLRGRQPSYREALHAVRDKLAVAVPPGATIQDLELEIFNAVVASFSELMPHSEEGAAPQGPSRVVNDFSRLPPVRWGRQLRSRTGAFLSHLAAPLTLSLSPDAVLPTLGKLGGAVAAARAAAPQLAAPVVTRSARFCLSLAAGSGQLSLRAKLALETATKTAALTAGRAGALQGLLAVAGPALWAWAVVDVALAAAGTDYARLTRATFALAQIRLLRTAGFQAAPPLAEEPLGI